MAPPIRLKRKQPGTGAKGVGGSTAPVLSPKLAKINQMLQAAPKPRQGLAPQVRPEGTPHDFTDKSPTAVKNRIKLMKDPELAAKEGSVVPGWTMKKVASSRNSAVSSKGSSHRSKLRCRM